MRSWKTPTTEQLDFVLARIDEPHRRAYFLGKLNSPSWIEPLRRRGFFRQQPDPVVDPETGNLRHPPWPESQYLARMACHAPREVCDILAGLPNTDNFLVYTDIVTAALAMRPSDAVALLPKVFEALNGQMAINIEHLLGELISHFASAGEIDHALELARATLRLLPASGDSNNWISYRNRPESLIDGWCYQAILAEDVSRVAEIAPLETVSLLLSLIDAGVSYTIVPESLGHDEWLIWERPRIEDDAPEWKADPIQMLMSSLRDAARSSWSTQPGRRLELLDQLETFRWKIGSRVALDTLAVADDAPLEWVRERLLDHGRFSDHFLTHEYKRLLSANFSRLDLKSRLTVLSWIDDGPDDAEEDSQIRSPDEIALYVKHWQREWLAVIAESLDEPWRGRFEKLMHDTALGPRTSPCEPAQGAFEWIGRTSPKSIQDLESMPVCEIVAFLNSWAPDRSRNRGRALRRPSVEGLANALADVAEARATEFSRDAGAFIGQKSPYVRSIVAGLAKAAKREVSLSWDAILDLCEWVNIQEDLRGNDLRAYNWSFARRECGDLLSAGFNSQAASIPFALRQRVWATIQALLSDGDPTIEHEEKYGPPNLDPWTLSINTTRGMAMVAVLEYARWTFRNIHSSELSSGYAGFDAMPEVRDVLEYHLHPANESSLAVRAVYGRYLPWLVDIDARWVDNFSEGIFPSTPNLEHLRNAAWITYLSTGPYASSFRLLYKQYEAAVDRIPSPEVDWLSDDDPDQKLVEHVIDLFLLGHIDIGGDRSLLRDIYGKASVELRSFGNGYLGMRLAQAGASGVRFAGRAQKFWDWRVSSVALMSEAQADVELRSFVSWTDAVCFDPNWILEKLYESLRVPISTEQGVSVYRISKWLEANIDKVSRKDVAVKCFRTIVEHHARGWFASILSDSCNVVLNAAMSSGDIVARREASELSEILVSRGFSNP